MAWPPQCNVCGTCHINSCDDAQEARQLWAAVLANFVQVDQPRTAMADVPSTLRAKQRPDNEEVTMGPDLATALTTCPDCDEPLLIPVRVRHDSRTVVRLHFDLSQAREHLATHEARIASELPPTAR
ncbi:hypothetical protein [Streptomyces sp. DH24]|uniref:hypothetical protein n=1 Tax=Streptomyces sp. DH24 TaxID=3040123 RepID=UPI0024425D06|nr:hypothetical protein [Streptomyces sp. DH24]MDG9717414.1 hypothetical protein [Streptomyces sp. DH24]